jgi:hypothetical protein
MTGLLTMIFFSMRDATTHCGYFEELPSVGFTTTRKRSGRSPKRIRADLDSQIPDPAQSVFFPFTKDKRVWLPSHRDRPSDVSKLMNEEPNVGIDPKKRDCEYDNEGSMH